MSRTHPIEGRLRLAGILIVLGLLAEAVSLLWSHPVAFIAFLLVSGSLLLCGMLLFLYSIVSPDSKSRS
jgi:hypothetical protein